MSPFNDGAELVRSVASLISTMANRCPCSNVNFVLKQRSLASRTANSATIICVHRLRSQDSVNGLVL